MKRGEVWLVSLPATGGREQAGSRPALVIQDAAHGQASPLVLTVPFTSQLSAERFPGTLRIEPSARNGLTVTSIAMVFQTRALDRRFFTRRLGSIEPRELQDVFEQLDRLLGRT